MNSFVSAGNQLLKSLKKSYTELFIISDSAGWVLDEEAVQLGRIAGKLGFASNIVKKSFFNLPQVFHYTSQFSLLDESIYKDRNKISVDYYHGKPKQFENERDSFTKCFQALERHHSEIERVRVSTKDMEGVIKSSGIDPIKVVRIPIGIDTTLFTPRTEEAKTRARDKFNLPQDAVVIGSFQKDGSGWGEGNDPKPIKGPDIFLKTIEKLHQDLPNLWILLSGPSRGYVKNGLEKLGIPYRHIYFKKFDEIVELYDAIDLYIIASREEGGPKACLESMAKGVPLVTTAVGQCKDLVVSGTNAMMVPIEDIEGLYTSAKQILSDKDLASSLVEHGYITARENSYDAQLPIWKEYFKPLLR